MLDTKIAFQFYGIISIIVIFALLYSTYYYYEETKPKERLPYSESVGFHNYSTMDGLDSFWSNYNYVYNKNYEDN